ncbi:MAG: hypothetical protein HWE34_12070 [Methylocystaceae bacterium]|nr:hypothetical protein [Methylocystaceae bacterium]
MGAFEIFMIISTILSTATATIQAQQQKKRAQQVAQAQADQASKDRWEAYERQEKERKDKLRKALAKKRAQMGAHGLSAADGSAGAIVQGLRTDEAEDTYQSYQDTKDSVETTMSGIQSDLLSQSQAMDRKVFNKIGQAASSIGGSLMKAYDEKTKQDALQSAED